MEIRRHFMPGQTLANTRISDLKTELHITADEWKKITQKLDSRKLKEEAIAKEQAKRKQMKEDSLAMVNAWEDSLINQYRKREREREQLLQQKEFDRMQTYLLLRKEQEKKRDEFIKEMREAAYKETGYPRDINAALLCSEVLYEREKQMEFNEMLKRKMEEQEREYAEKVKRDAEQEKIEKEEERKKLLEQKLYLKEFYYKQMKESEAKAQEERRQKFEVEAIDNLKAVEDIERIENLKKKKAEEQRKQQREFTLRNLKECEERKKIEKSDEMEKDMLIAIQEAAKDRLELLKKQRKYELEQKMVARRMAISSKVAGEAQECAEKEKRIMEKAQADYDKKEEEAFKAKVEKARKLREDRMKNYKLAMEEEERKKQCEAEVKRWETMNRYKVEEYTKEYAQKKKEEEWRRVLQHRAALKAQIVERQEMERREKLADVESFKRQICKDEEDDKFYKYAEEVLNSAKSKGRSTYPIEKVIEKYQKENNLAALAMCKKRSSAVIVPEKPGRMAYDRNTDPNYNKCRSKVLYDDNQ